VSVKRSRITGLKGWREEDGIALATAMYSLVVVGGLVSAVFLVSVTERRLGLNTLKTHGAFAAADGGAAEILSRWEAGRYNYLAAGGSAVLGQRWMGSSGWYAGTVRRLNERLYFIAVEAYSPDSAARQTVGLLARLKPLEMDFNAALKTRGSVHLGASSYLSGGDELPAGWTDCPAPRSTLPAIGLPPTDSATIQASGCPNYACLSGSPKIQPDSTISQVFPTTVGDDSLADLSTLATKMLPPGSYDGIGPRVDMSGGCDAAAPLNWGDPVDRDGPCGGHFPFIFISGHASVSGGTGQGVLVVDGDLQVDGGFQFYGAVIVAGTLSITGAGGAFTGGVAAGGADLAPSSVLGRAVVSYSSCALRRAVMATATAAPLGERAWLSLY
jgi:hypothetical protein